MNKSRFAFFLLLIFVFGLLAGGFFVSAQSGAGSLEADGRESWLQVESKLSTWVLATTANGEMTEFLVVLKDQADLSPAELLKTKAEKNRFVFETLRAKAQATQRPLLSWLKEQNLDHRPFYIINAIWVKATREIAIELAQRPDVASIDGNPQLTGIQPISSPINQPFNLTVTSLGIESGVSYIRAPEVWAMGFKGQGIVIGGQDTGVDWGHPALREQYRGWNGAGADHDYNWHDSVHTGGGVCGPDSMIPCDDNNHGTHTLGTAVGSDGWDNQIGVAPAAKFISCRNMDRGKGTPATYLECFQFFLAPYPVDGSPEQGDPSKAPDITTNSWTCPPSEGCAPETLKAAVEAHRAAGIMTVVAAGNAGAACSSVVDPPALYESSYSVGALITGAGTIAPFSSRGPVKIDGSNRIKPDIAAPGVAVRSAIRNGNYAAYDGTSMATPHVAGAVALLWSAYPELRGQISLTENILNQSALRMEMNDCRGDDAQNNVYGFGRLDVKAAFDLAATRLTPVEQVFGIPGGSGKVEVAALAGVSWRVATNDSWITITSVATGFGPGEISFQVSENTGPTQRTGTLSIAGRQVTIRQAGRGQFFEVSGRITTDSGAGIGRVVLTFTRLSGEGEAPQPVQSDEGGYWSQSGFEAGATYRVTASRSRVSFTPSSHDFSATASTLDFTSLGRRVVMGVQR